jgi:hypothetical protein
VVEPSQAQVYSRGSGNGVIGFRSQGLDFVGGYRGPELRFVAWGLRFRVQGLGIRVYNLGVEVSGEGFGIMGR